MKILYGIQCTGNGHLSRSLKIINKLKSLGHTVDILLSGKDFNKEIPNVKYRFNGFTFSYTSHGKINYLKTITSLKIITFLRDIRLNVNQYDKVISDFEPITAWACKLQGKKCYGVSNQYSILNETTSKKYKNLIGNLILKYMAPVNIKIGLSYSGDGINIFKPIINDTILNATISNYNHYTVYLPSYNLPIIINSLSTYEEITFHVFHNSVNTIYKYKNCLMHPIDNKLFLESFANCDSIITNAGFQTSSEALYMSKKLMVISIKGQYEQKCNEIELNKLGIFSGTLNDIGDFINSKKIVIQKWNDPINYIVNIILNNY